jgi:alpha-D-ribose 1-methylphosphonate 5-triphosphate synthase subunit PhnH
MTHPAYTAAEARSRETFLALMWALSYPGSNYSLPDAGEPLVTIAETLLDLETSYYTPDDDALAAALAHTGARNLPPDGAAYHFYPVLSASALAAVQQASAGTMLYPDTAATLIIGCTFGGGMSLRLEGPGIDGQTHVDAGDLPEAFWELRRSVCRFPLGWDVYFVDGRRVMGLPRSTKVTQLS